MNILIADDDAVTRRVLAHYASTLGHQTETASNGEDAWGMLSAFSFPVVIFDWMMPDITGLELCRRLRRRPREQGYVYVILLTSVTGKDRYLEAMESGVDDFLTKPPDLDELGARIKVAERILGLELHVQRLEGLLPICGYCKKIRNEDEGGRWQPIEGYLAKRTESRLSHGICPECEKRYVEPQLEALE